MKKITLLTLFLFGLSNFYGQKKEVADPYYLDIQKKISKCDNQNKTVADSINRWTIELMVGQGKGIRPYSVGYYSSQPGVFFGNVQANSFSLGARYMIGPKFGLKMAFLYDDFKNIKNNGSLPYEMVQMGVSIQGVINMARLLSIDQQLRRFGLLVHGGVDIVRSTSKTADVLTFKDHNYNISEFNGGLVFGATPQYRIGKKMALQVDVSITNNYRQHFNWDGAYSTTQNNLSGQLVRTSLGLTYSFGNDREIHGDWEGIADGNMNKINELEKRLGQIETHLDDTDKDGVPDYLDQENNSVAGVAVDTRGKMIDLNKNGVPDELERNIEKSTKENSANANTDVAKNLINQGLVCAYFDFNQTEPTDVSTEGIDFVRTYLKNNPTATVEIIGHADEIGNTQNNLILSKNRAEVVKITLINSGIEASRLFIKGDGIDESVNIKSEAARRLIRKVTFKIK